MKRKNFLPSCENHSIKSNTNSSDSDDSDIDVFTCDDSQPSPSHEQFQYSHLQTNPSFPQKETRYITHNQPSSETAIRLQGWEHRGLKFKKHRYED